MFGKNQAILPSIGKMQKVRAGFTMFELLMVVVILGIASGVAVPYFAASMKGAKLRVSARMVVSTHRQTQCQAILRGRQYALLFDERKGTLESVSVEVEDEADPFFSAATGGGGNRNSLGSGLNLGGGLGGRTARAAADEPAATATSENVRSFEDGVAITGFRGGKEVAGLHYVMYYPNGTCTPYEVTLSDGKRSTRITVDPVTGKAKTDSR
jgi:prepilin-type N-terminal cleavage/methylation domain-containing protein